MRIRPTDDQGQPLLSACELALLLGVSEAELKAHAAAAGTGATALPEEWVARGKERSHVYQHATGRSDMGGAMAYWAAQQ